MKTSLIYFSTLIFMLFLIACSTVEEDEPAVTTDASGNVISRVENADIEATDSSNFIFLVADSVSKKWDTKLFTLAGSTDFTSCRLDDEMMLFQDGKYSYQGGQLCGAEDSESIRNGIWMIDYTNNKIIFDKGTTNEYEAEVIGLTDNELRVKGTYMGMEVRALYAFN